MDTSNKTRRILIFSSLFSMILLALRIVKSENLFYMGMAWNLFLAWIPFLISNYLIKRIYLIKSRFIILIWMGTWLLFLPNAPYILTDFIHLYHRWGAPVWYDLAMIISFAWTGLLLGLTSLLEIQRCIAIKTNPKTSWIFTLAFILFSGFGIYLGRYHRWNSWDILTNPTHLITDIFRIIKDPYAYQQAYGVTVIFASMLFVFYLMFIHLFNVDSSLITAFSLKNKK